MAPDANGRRIRNLEFLINAISCLIFTHFIPVWPKRDIVFP
jgi:hypothetical protein